jgi:hypothetical protein
MGFAMNYESTPPPATITTCKPPLTTTKYVPEQQTGFSIGELTHFDNAHEASREMEKKTVFRIRIRIFVGLLGR